MQKKSLGLNAVLNTIKSALSIIFPLITYPYAVRVLQAEGIGQVNYAQSIVNYFALIAALGVSMYAIREGAKIRDNKDCFQRFVNEVFTINMVTTVFAYAALVITIVLIKPLQNYSLLILICSISMLLTTLGVDWINTVYEDFLFITVRSIVTHILSMILLYICVRTKSDVYMYAVLTVLTNAVVCVSNWFYCKKYVSIRLVRVPNIKKHLTPMITLFANTLAITIYVNSDITMLGWICGDYVVGLYSVAAKIYKIIKSMLAAVYSVAVPRLSNLAGEGKFDEFKTVYTDLLNSLIILLIPAGVGLAIISPEIILFMAGEEYNAAIGALQILSIAFVMAILGGAFTTCLNIPLRREKANLKLTVVSAVLNIALNSVLIPVIRHYGAAVATTFSEMFVMVGAVATLPNKDKYIDVKSVFKNFLEAVGGSIGIAVVSFAVRHYFKTSLLSFVLIMSLSVLVYAIFMMAVKNKYVFRLPIVKKVFRNK